ncbi:hypothetical protein QFZ36_001024 [Pseudarthrobacter siccitolerans]|uniref:Uncharacterized protein n=1 Tax=Pseudarthrobacter siccitolerans TaxID=861266 RepID=A0ABU0PHM6_9MICC|nr:hypothetical protein [Pseudarthrobacter siccitolerans]MDQ0673463.1 hypothetical protein [Pseudarthrobacter siccitolerans]
MNNSRSCSGGRWCTRADTLLLVEGIHLRSVTATEAGMVLGVETGDFAGVPESPRSATDSGRPGVMTLPVSVGRCG